jgi:hypothetical protein
MLGKATLELAQGQRPCTSRESQCTDWQKGSLPEGTNEPVHKLRALLQELHGGEQTVREVQRGLICAGGTGPRRRLRAEMFSEAG